MMLIADLSIYKKVFFMIGYLSQNITIKANPLLSINAAKYDASIETHRINNLPNLV